MNISEIDIKEALVVYPSIIEYIKNPTEEMLFIAVQNYGGVLEIIENPTEEMCLAAVKQDGMALEYVKEQTPEICLEAVKENSGALRYVKEQTPELCLIAFLTIDYRHCNEEIKDSIHDSIFYQLNVEDNRKRRAK